MSKQDRQGVRTPVDLERKYGLGSMGKKFSEVKEISTEARDSVAVFARELRQEFNDGLRTASQQIAGLRTDMGTALEAAESETDQKIAALQTALETSENETSQAISTLRSDLRKVDQEADQAIASLRSEHENYESETNQKLGILEETLESTQRKANEASTNAQAVINDMNTHFLFEEGGTRILGAIVSMVLPAGTDLDGVMIPNKYKSGSVADSDYLNCPITTGTFSLEVESCGNEGQLLQRLTYSHKTEGKTFERVFYQDEWGQWVLVSDYAWASVETVEDEADTLEAAFNKFKTDTNNAINTISNDVDALDSNTQALSRNVQSLSTDLQGVINDVNDHFDFTEGGVRIKGAINSALIPAGTDLDSLLIPNKYVGGIVTEYNYVNCPVPSGTFLLNVESCGEQGQLKQSLSYCNKTLARTYERYYYGSSWGEWVCVTDFVPAEPEETGKLLWNDGVYYMTATQTVNLPEAVSAQRNGIILVFSEYSGGALDAAFHCFFVPKTQVATHPGGECVFTLATSNFAYMATKRVFVYDTKIEGHADNNQTGTGGSGVKFTNNRFVLRYVFGI